MSEMLPREELMDLVKRIMTVRDQETGRVFTEEVHTAMVVKFKNSICDPGGSDLIYYPELIEGYPKERELTLDEIVDMAMKDI